MVTMDDSLTQSVLEVTLEDGCESVIVSFE